MRSGNEGFTLFEALAVITLIGVVSALAAPAIHSATVERRVGQASLDLVRIARQARAGALGYGRAHLVHYTVGDQGRAAVFRGLTDRCNGTDWSAIVDEAACANAFCVDELRLDSTRYSSIGNSTVNMTELNDRSPIQICYEPSGVVMHRVGTAVAAGARFSDANTEGGGFVFLFQRLDDGVAEGVPRRVLIPLGSDARIVR